MLIAHIQRHKNGREEQKLYFEKREKTIERIGTVIA